MDNPTLMVTTRCTCENQVFNATNSWPVFLQSDRGFGSDGTLDQGQMHVKSVKVKSRKYTPTNRRTPLAVRPLEALAPGKDDGTPTGTEVTPLTQHPITKLPLAIAGKEQGSRIFSLTQHDTINCYPIGQAVRSPEVRIGRGNYK
ncbi:hypothetical protein TNCV_1254621 [Trichonephila clavipes]|nr:hypothetical protein TNCV_1254621 [Trichonephila clavipes]